MDYLYHEVVLGVPAPAGEFKPIYGADGKPALAAVWNPADTTTPLALNYPAMCESPCPYAHGDSLDVYVGPGTLTRCSAAGATLAWTAADLFGEASAIIRMLAPAGKKRITLALSFDTPGLDTSTDNWLRWAAVSATVLARVTVNGQWGWTPLAALDYKNPESSSSGSVCMEIWDGPGGQPPRPPASVTSVSFGVWHRFALQLQLFGVAYSDNPDPGDYWPGEVRVDFGWE